MGEGVIGTNSHTQIKVARRILHHNFLFWLSAIFLVAFFYILMRTRTIAQQWIQSADRSLFLVAAVVIVIFFAAVLYYGQRYILRQSSQEIALYKLWGISNRLLYRTIAQIGLLMLVLVVITGVGFGLLFAPLAVLLLQRFMGLPTHFVGPWNNVAVGQTIFWFGVIAVFLQLDVMRQVAGIKPLRLLHMKTGMPDSRRWGPPFLGTILGVLATATGFGLAVNFWPILLRGKTTSPWVLLGLMNSILLLVVAGEFLLVRSGLPLLFNGLRRLPQWPLRKNRLLRLSRLQNQFRSQALVLWGGAILLSIVVSVGGMLTTTLSVANRQSIKEARMTFVTTDRDSWLQLQKQLTGMGVNVNQVASTPFKIQPVAYGIKNQQTGQRQMTMAPAAIMRQSDYRKLQPLQDLDPLQTLRGNEAALSDLYSANLAMFSYLPPRVKTRQAKLVPWRAVAKLDTPYSMDLLPTTTMVVTDKMWRQINPAQTITLYGLNTATDPSTTQINKALAVLPKTRMQQYFSVEGNAQQPQQMKLKVTSSKTARDQFVISAPVVQAQMRREIGVNIFVGLVLSVVILFAVNSMLTLRAWAERTSGVDLFFTLGMTADEIRRMEYSELAWRYSLPVLLATLNALFALQILWQVIDYQNSLALFLLVLGGIALVSWVFFILSAQMVRRSVTPR